jgi:hypothetical protein
MSGADGGILRKVLAKDGRRSCKRRMLVCFVVSKSR